MDTGLKNVWLNGKIVGHFYECEHENSVRINKLQLKKVCRSELLRIVNTLDALGRGANSIYP